MSVIEGIGDEVTVFVIVLFVAVTLVLGWLSTRVTDLPSVSIIILDARRSRRFVQRLRQIAGVVINGNFGQLDEAAAEEENAEAANQEVRAHSDDADSSTPVESSPEISRIEPSSNDVKPNQNLSDIVTSPSIPQVNIHHTPLLAGTLQVPAATANKPLSLVQARIEQPVLTSQILHDVEELTGSHETSSPLNHPSKGSTENEEQTSDGPLLSEENLNGNSDTGIRIRLKYLNEQQREVRAQPEDTIGQFKRQHFASELAENLNIRFIYNGHELGQETSTLASYNVSDNSVIHCLLTQTQQPAAGARAARDNAELDFGRFMMPMLAIILAVLWYWRLVYRLYFSGMANVMLIGLTVLFGIFALAAWHRRAPQRPVHQ